MSLMRAERIGPTTSGMFELNTAAIRVRPHSTSSTYTMSAWVRPAWGCARPVLGILMTITGLATQFGRPVNGDRSGDVTAGVGEVAAEEALGELDVAATDGEISATSPFEHAAKVPHISPMPAATKTVCFFT